MIEFGEPDYTDDELKNMEFVSKLEMYNAEMDFTEAMESLGKVEKEFYLNPFKLNRSTAAWLGYIKEHKN